jgi:regulator of RNase E activity RraA
MTRAWKRGVAGFVTDGGLRDGHVLSQLPFPTYPSTVTITTRAAWHHVADLQVPISCAGVAVYPGDVLVADRDGIIVVPRSWAAELADPSLEQEQLEAYVATNIRAGLPLAGNYPPPRRRNPSTRDCWPRRGQTVPLQSDGREDE